MGELGDLEICCLKQSRMGDSLMPIVKMGSLAQMFPDSKVLTRHKTHDARIACHHEFDFLFPSDNGGCMLAYDFWAHLPLL